MKWADIARAVKGLGYAGEANDLAKTVEFLESENVTLTEADGSTPIDLKAAHAASTRKAIAVTPEADKGDESETDDSGTVTTKGNDADARIKRLEEKLAQAELRAKGGTDWANAHDGVLVNRKAVSWAREADRKSYNAKAKDGKVSFSDADTAEQFTAWFRQSVAKGRSYGQAAHDREVMKKGQFVYDDSLGGSLVPDQFMPDLIKLREQYGEVSPLCRQVTMTSDTLKIQRHTGGLTAYRIGEGNPLTESSTTYDTVTLTASKDGVLASYSYEIFQDATIGIADELAGEIMYAFTKAEDDAIINGDGTSNYTNNAVGLALRFRQLVEGAGGTWATNAAYGAGIHVGTGNLWSELVDADYSTLNARLPKYVAASPNCTWLTSHTHWGQTMEPLVRAAGGATVGDFQGKLAPAFKGYRVTTSQLMPRVDANSSFVAYLGDFSKAVTIGRVGGIRIDTSKDFDFDNDKFTVKGVHRVAIAVHDLGNASSTASSRVPGPVVGLITAAS